MRTAVLEFQIKRGVVDSDLDDDAKELHDRCLSLIEAGQLDEAVAELLPQMYFEWSWANGDGDPEDFFENVTDEICFDCTSENTSLKVGVDEGRLVVTASCQFQMECTDGATEDDLSEWLEDNAAYACGFVSAGWSYAGSDGDNVTVVSLK